MNNSLNDEIMNDFKRKALISKIMANINFVIMLLIGFEIISMTANGIQVPEEAAFSFALNFGVYLLNKNSQLKTESAIEVLKEIKEKKEAENAESL